METPGERRFPRSAVADPRVSEVMLRRLRKVDRVSWEFAKGYCVATIFWVCGHRRRVWSGVSLHNPASMKWVHVCAAK